MTIGKWLGLITLLICLYILWELRQLLLLVFASILLATALNRLVKFIQRYNIMNKYSIKRPLAIMFTLIFVLGVTLLLYLIIVPPFINQFQELITEKIPQVLQFLLASFEALKQNLPASIVSSISDYDALLEQLRQFFQDIQNINKIGQQLPPIINIVFQQFLSFFSSTLTVLIQLLLVIALAIILLIQPQSYRKGFIRFFPAFYRHRVAEILDKCELSLGAWFIGALISMSVVAFLSTIGLAFIGVPLALAQGILAGLLNFIPNIGPTLSVVLPMGIAVLDSPWKAILVLVLYLLIQHFESNFLTPYVMSKQLELLPAITLLSQVFFATFFGFLGFLLALPLTVVGRVWVSEVIVKDLLDQWGPVNDETQTEIVVVNRNITNRDTH